MPTGLTGGVTHDNQEWVIDFANFREAWAKTPTALGGKTLGEGVFIAHPDTGYTRHPEINAPNYITDDATNPNSLAKNFLKPNNSANDKLDGWNASHGTSTASVIVSPRGHASGRVTNPETAREPANSATAFVSGVAPKATVIPFLVDTNVVLDADSDAGIAAAIYYCIGLRKRSTPVDVGVMSISMGRPPLCIEDKLRTALKVARENGIVVIAAGGQAHRWLPINPLFPGLNRDTICVAACDSQGGEYPDGFHGEAVDITTPGIAVWRARTELDDNDNQVFIVAPSTGTSYATALTAGACALWQAFHSRDALIAKYGLAGITGAFWRCLTNSADSPNGWDSARRGAGYLDMQALLEAPLPDATSFDNDNFRN